MKRLAGVGVRGVVAAALSEYETKRSVLERRGLTRSEVDACILREARERGGILFEGERINLALYCDDESEREVLEALALATLRSFPIKPRRVDAPPPLEPMPADEPFTPPPEAQRVPRLPLSER